MPCRARETPLGFPGPEAVTTDPLNYAVGVPDGSWPIRLSPSLLAVVRARLIQIIATFSIAGYAARAVWFALLTRRQLVKADDLNSRVELRSILSLLVTHLPSCRSVEPGTERETVRSNGCSSPIQAARCGRTDLLTGDHKCFSGQWGTEERKPLIERRGRIMVASVNQKG